MIFLSPQHLGLTDVFLHGVVVSGAPTRSSAMLPVTIFFSPQHLDLGKEEERDGPTPICNQSINRLSWTNGSPCLAASDVIYFLSSRFIFSYSVTSMPFSPSPPLPGRETVYIVHDCHGRGEYLFFTVTFCSFVCHSCSFLFLCCFPAACPLLLLFLSRRARTRHTP